jgi:hypothetical protein
MPIQRSPGVNRRSNAQLIVVKFALEVRRCCSACAHACPIAVPVMMPIVVSRRSAGDGCERQGHDEADAKLFHCFSSCSKMLACESNNFAERGFPRKTQPKRGFHLMGRCSGALGQPTSSGRTASARTDLQQAARQDDQTVDLECTSLSTWVEGRSSWLSFAGDCAVTHMNAPPSRA